MLMAIGSVTLVTDIPGRIFTGIAAAGLILFASVSWRARPKLAITANGLVVRGWLRTQLLRRPQVKIIRIVEFRRIGRKLRLLEIETVDDQLRIFSRWDLGTDPLEVLDALTAAGYAGPEVSETSS
ncbi:PH domain-containing protein [Mycobacterium heckeshornense]|uniref:PH domain-containing protein n=1 Tax=Mycobacterium heckeshornense TaxID=110505 RepID=UPI0019436DA4|nr:PH domain-containing protein [Mycobacterium heckeshornense]